MLKESAWQKGWALSTARAGIMGQRGALCQKGKAELTRERNASAETALLTPQFPGKRVEEIE